MYGRVVRKVDYPIVVFRKKVGPVPEMQTAPVSTRGRGRGSGRSASRDHKHPPSPIPLCTPKAAAPGHSAASAFAQSEVAADNAAREVAKAAARDAFAKLEREAIDQYEQHGGGAFARLEREATRPKEVEVESELVQLKRNVQQVWDGVGGVG